MFPQLIKKFDLGNGSRKIIPVEFRRVRIVFVAKGNLRFVLGRFLYQMSNLLGLLSSRTKSQQDVKSNR